MLNMDKRLIRCEEEGKNIRTGVVGAGQMGRGLVTQMMIMHGLTPAILSDHTAEKAVNAFRHAGVADEDIAVARTLEEANRFMEQGKYVVTEDSDILCRTNLTQCVIDATGIPDVGAHVATAAMTNHKHVVMLNVETDIVIGSYLKKLGDENGVIYTGADGDEPCAAMHLYSLAKAIGLDVVAMGKGKNNTLDYDCNPDTVREEAIARGMSPKMLSSFKDGTKTMVELTAMSNATGLTPNVVGADGVKVAVGDTQALNDIYRLKEDGGILNHLGVVDYVDGIAPGVFVTVTTTNEEAIFELNYLKVGPGPQWTLYRPFHLCNLETPLSVARAVLVGEPSIVPLGEPVSECITRAKIDLHAGETIDGMGGYTTYASIATAEETRRMGYVPYGLVTKKARMKKDAKKGQMITWDMIDLETDTLVYQIRKKQDEMYGYHILK